jgi:hypothetical protein
MLARVAKTEGYQVMLRDAYTFVSVDCEWYDKEDKFNLVKHLINDVGAHLTQKSIK